MGGDEVFNQEKEKNNRITRKKNRKEKNNIRRKKYKVPLWSVRTWSRSWRVVCGACCLWIHNGKTKKCAGLEGKDEANSDTFRCPKCIESDQKVNAHLRKQTLDQYNIMAKSSKKRTIQDSSPKKDEIGNMSKNKKQKVDNEYEYVS